MNAVTTGNYIRIVSNIESGIPPLEVVLRVDSSFTMNSPMLYSQGPAPMESIDCPNYENCKVRFTAEGIYTLTAEAKDAQNITYTDSISIIVLNKTQLDTLLKAKWEGMKDAMIIRDIQKASSYFIDWTKERYAGIFTALGDRLPQVAQDMQNIRMIYLRNGVAKYRIRRLEAAGEITYYIYFVQDENGVWKIQQF